MRWQWRGGLGLLGGADNVVWWWWWGCCEGGGGGGILGLRGRVRARERERAGILGLWRVRERYSEWDKEIQCFWQKWKAKKKKKTEGRFRERVRRSIVAVQPTTITKKNCCKKESLLRRSYKHCYSSHIATFFFTAAIVYLRKMMYLLQRVSEAPLYLSYHH